MIIYDEWGPIAPRVWEIFAMLHKAPPKMFHVEHVPPPEPTVSQTGRWSWPDLFHYVVEGPPWAPEFTTISDYPPLTREPIAATLARPEAMLGMSAIQPRTPPYRIVLTGPLEQFEAIWRSGMLNDQRHTGAGSNIVDNRKAPGA